MISILYAEEVIDMYLFPISQKANLSMRPALVVGTVPPRAGTAANTLFFDDAAFLVDVSVT